MKTIIILAAALSLTGCNGIGTAKQMNAASINSPTIPEVLQVGKNILSRDSIPPVEYPTLTSEQLDELARLTGIDLPDTTQYIGSRMMRKRITLEAYKIPLDEEPNHFMVYLVTRSNDGTVIDTLDLKAFHTSEYQGRPRLGGNRFYTTDASITFATEGRFTLHRVMTLTGLYLKDHRLTELWRVEWDNDYEIDESGHFQFGGQRETYRSATIDDSIIEQYKSRDLPNLVQLEKNH